MAATCEASGPGRSARLGFAGDWKAVSLQAISFMASPGPTVCFLQPGFILPCFQCPLISAGIRGVSLSSCLFVGLAGLKSKRWKSHCLSGACSPPPASLREEGRARRRGGEAGREASARPRESLLPPEPCRGRLAPKGLLVSRAFSHIEVELREGPQGAGRGGDFRWAKSQELE